MEQTTDTQTAEQSQAAGKCTYGKELRCMMYGFGDDKNPYTESVELLEELVLKYIKQTTLEAIAVRRTGKITVEDILYLIRKDRRKSDRVKELLFMNEELKKSLYHRKFDQDNYNDTMTIEYYLMRESPPCRAVSLTASVLGIKMNEHPVNLMAKEHLTEAMLKLNPRHVVPFIIDGDLKMNESRAIICYLANKSRSDLYPTDAVKRARIDEILYFDASNLFPKLSQMFIPLIMGRAKEVNAEHLSAFEDAAQALEQKLSTNGGKKLMLGDELTLADISLAASLSMLEMKQIGLKEFKHLNNYLKNVKAAIPKYHEISDPAIEKMRNFMLANANK